MDVERKWYMGAAIFVYIYVSWLAFLEVQSAWWPCSDAEKSYLRKYRGSMYLLMQKCPSEYRYHFIGVITIFSSQVSFLNLDFR